MSNVDHYTYRVFWSAEDQENVGLCAEFPGLSHLAEDPMHALAGIRKLVAFVVSDLRKGKKPIPEPLGAQTFSGQLHVRIPPNVHRALAFEAKESGTSLNRVIVDRIAGSRSGPGRRVSNGSRAKVAKKVAKHRRKVA
jgi:predicted HicB family RNase H-like nuclease